MHCFKIYMLSFLFLNQNFNFSSHLIVILSDLYFSICELRLYVSLRQLNIGIYSGFRMLSEFSFIELSIFRFGVRVFYCRVRVSQTRVRARVRVFPESGFSSPVRCHRKFGPPKIWPPRAKFPRKYVPPPGAIFPRKFGPRFGNLAPLHKHGC